jgi:hypothetical protein
LDAGQTGAFEPQRKELAMSRINLALIAAAGLVSALPMAASAADDSKQQVDIMGHGTMLLRSDQYEAMRGEYLMTNGSRVWIEGGRTRPAVAIDDREPVLLVVTGPNRFASVDGRMQLEFHAHNNGNIDGLTLTAGGTMQVSRR